MSKWGKIVAAGLASGSVGAVSTIVLVNSAGMQHMPPDTKHVGLHTMDRGWVMPLVSHFVVYGVLGAAIAAAVT